MDDTLQTAVDLGVLSGVLNLNGSLGSGDTVDLYRFTLNQNADFAAEYSIVGTGLRVRLISDINGNGIVENNEVVRTIFGSSENFLEPLPVGTYFLEFRGGSISAINNYSIRLVETPKPSNISPDPGNSIAQALNLGPLTGVRVLRDYVGTLDEVDFYRFSITQASNLGIIVSGETRRTPVRIIADRNNNGVVDSGEQVTARFGTGSSFSANLAPGTYFLLVGAEIGTITTQYVLTLNQTIDLTGNNILRGTAGQNVLRGLEGNDLIYGFGGNDSLFGGVGNDRLFGGIGNDNLVGDTGNDNLVGEAGNDILLGGLGNDTLNGGSGLDRLVGGAGKDIQTGGIGADTFVISSLTDSLLGTFDRITDLRIGVDRIDGPNIVSAARLRKLGGVSSLTPRGIAARLTTTTFAARGAATFTFGARRFVAMNDTIAGFQANQDAVIEITGFTGNINSLSIV